MERRCNSGVGEFVSRQDALSANKLYLEAKGTGVPGWAGSPDGGSIRWTSPVKVLRPDEVTEEMLANVKYSR